MKGLAAVILLAWYVSGLVLLFNASHYVWMVFGFIIPIIPYIYTAVKVIEHFSS